MNRWAAVVFCLVICGCAPRGRVVVKEEVQDVSGNNRLALVDRDITTVLDMFRGHRSYDFGSLVWRTNDGAGMWRTNVVITHSEFQGARPQRRWASGVHSIDAQTGNAIIMVGEESPPVAVGGGIQTTVAYSWREWNLRTNGEVQFFRVCVSPFEKY